MSKTSRTLSSSPSPGSWSGRAATSRCASSKRWCGSTVRLSRVALDHEWFIDGAVAESDRLSWVADGADPALPVPGCPGWTISKLVKHTGTVHRWVTEIVATRSSSPVSQRSLELGLPAKESD